MKNIIILNLANKLVENSLNTVVDATKQASDKIISNLGVGIATGYAVSTVTSIINLY
jgi:hypothetical protein